MNPELSQQLLQGIVSVVVIIITGYLIPWLKAEIEKRKLDFIYDWIEKAVFAAEKIAEKQEINKREYVLAFIRTKFNLSDIEAEILLESAVKILNMEDVFQPEEPVIVDEV